MSTIQRIRHEMLASDKTARLLEDAAREIDMSRFDSNEASLIRIARRDYEQAVQLPGEFVADRVDGGIAAGTGGPAIASGTVVAAEGAANEREILRRGDSEERYRGMVGTVEQQAYTATWRT